MKIIKILILRNNITSINSYGLFEIFSSNFYTKDILANMFRRYLINNLMWFIKTYKIKMFLIKIN